MRGRIFITACLTVAVAPSALLAQLVASQANGGKYRLLPEAEEIALAESAAPVDVGRGATIYVLRVEGFAKVRDGTNGFTCIVARDHPESIIPICYDAEASRTILPAEFREIELRTRGLDEASITREIDRDFAAGKLTAPKRPAMTYMMSRDQILYDPASGRRAGAWYPHVMIFYPNLTAADMGVFDPAAPGRLQVALAGTPRAHVVVPTRDWSRPETVRKASP